jgi:hypothetical protein
MYIITHKREQAQVEADLKEIFSDLPLDIPDSGRPNAGKK